MSHSSFSWGCKTSNESNNWLVFVVIFSNPFSSLFFILTSNFSNHDNTFSLWINHESFKNINEISSIERISTNSNNSGLAKASSSCLINSFIGQGPRSGNDTDFSILVDVPRHNSNLAFVWLNNSWTVRSNNARFILRSEGMLDSDHVMLWDTVGNDDNQADFCF